MRALLLFFSLLLCSFAAFSQEPAKADLAPCGAPPGISPWLREYFARPPKEAAVRSQDTLYVGLQVHLLATDLGLGRISPDRLLSAFCRLNADFAGAGVRFYFKNDWNLIDSTVWFEHTTIPQGINMMLTSNVPEALNSYFAANVAGNCGYNLPYAGVAVSHGCAAPNDHTWSHEVGHALSLPHPFIGWEGKVYSPINPTPTMLTYDYTYFHDTIDTQVPAPLDTALVEYLDGSNCDIAADLICDTKADYLSYRWDCDGQNNSFVKQKDPSGAEFYSDGSLFMSYAFDQCQSRFSPEETAILRANLLTEKADWLTDNQAQANVAGPVVPLSPINGALSPEVGTVLTWAPAPNATHYVVQFSRFSTFIVVETEGVTNDTTFTLGDLLPNKLYYWRVRPFNFWDACTSFAPQQSFLTTTPSSATEPDADGWRCYPSLLVPGQPLTLEIPESWLSRPAQCSIFDATGRLMWQSPFVPAQLKTNLDLPSTMWPAGAYRLVFANEKGAKTQTLILG